MDDQIEYGRIYMCVHTTGRKWLFRPTRGISRINIMGDMLCFSPGSTRFTHNAVCSVDYVDRLATKAERKLFLLAAIV